MEPTTTTQPTDASLNPSQTQPGAQVDPSSQPNAGGAINPTAGQFIPRERLNEEIQKRRALEEQLQQMQQAKVSTPTTPQSAPQDPNRQYARTMLGIDEDLERVKREAAEEARKAAEEVARQEAEKARTNIWLQNEETRLRSKYDGADGILPAFDVKDVLAHGAQRGIYDLESAYRDKYFDKFVEKERLHPSNPTTQTERPGASAANFKPISQEDMDKMSLEEIEKLLPHE